MMTARAGSIILVAGKVDVTGFTILSPSGGPCCKSRWGKGSRNLDPEVESVAVAETLLEAGSMSEDGNACENQIA